MFSVKFRCSTKVKILKGLFNHAIIQAARVNGAKKAEI